MTTRETAGRRHDEAEWRLVQAGMDGAGDSILWISREGRIEYANAAAAAGRGYTREELPGLGIGDLDPAMPPAAWSAFFADRRHRGALTHESRHRAKEGRLFPVEINASHVRCDDREFICLIARDITGRKAAEEERAARWQRDAEQRKFDALSTLAGGLAHDFNNILTGMLGFVDLARLDLPANHGVQKSLEIVARSGQRATDLVRKILTMSRHGDRCQVPLRFSDTVTESLLDLRATLPPAVRLEHAISPDCPAVLADAAQLQQVVTNLCTNAWQALPEQGGTIRVELRPIEITPSLAGAHAGLRPGPGVTLTVGDDGCGMSAGTMAHLFEPFFTTRSEGEGAGLGLAIVHGIVRAHDAGITVQSTPGQGTLFTLYFSACDPAVAPAPADTGIHPPGGEARSS